jgi:hypothetical protein
VAPDKPKDNEAATGDKVSTEVATNKSKTAKKNSVTKKIKKKR